MRRAARNVGAVVTLGLCALVVSGCTGRIEPKALVPQFARAPRQHNAAVSIEVSGGRETDATGLPQISNEAFAEALSTAIASSQLFSRVEASGAPYQLTAVIASLQQPVMGYTMTVSMEVGWRLRSRETGQVVWQKGIRSSSTLGVGDAFNGATRVRLATEAAARENIRLGLGELAQLQL